MSEELKEIKDIRKEKETLGSLIKTFQRMYEELKEKEELLLKKFQDTSPIEYMENFARPKTADALYSYQRSEKAFFFKTHYKFHCQLMS